MTAPRISVILPTYNRAHMLARAIDSVLRQAWQDFELLVIDDGSTDETPQLMQSRYGDDRRIRYLRRPVNGGPAAARNTGLEVARGALIAFQDSDDEWLHERLSALLAPFDADDANRLALASCAMVRLTPGRPPYCFPPREILRHGDDVKRATRLNQVAFTQTWLARRECLLAAGSFDESLWIWEDWDLLLRISERWQIRYVPTPGVVSHATPDSVSSDLERRVQALRILVAKYGGHPDRDFVARLHYLLARFNLHTGEVKAARDNALQALRRRPADIKAALLLLAAVVGARA
jgi:glycosyltransferase involved in cell wall biosynthesis